MRKIVTNNPFEDLQNQNVQYWLGWLASDGVIYENRIILSLKKGDEDVILKFRDFLSKDLTVNYGVHKKPFGNFEYCKVAFRSNIVRDFLEKLGLTSRKTLNLKINMPITWHYMRGFIEGDGCIDKLNTARPRIQIASSSYEHLEQISNFFKQNDIYHLIYNKSKNRISPHWSLEIVRKKDVLECLTKLYNNADTFMDRKYHNAMQGRNILSRHLKFREPALGILSEINTP